MKNLYGVSPYVSVLDAHKQINSILRRKLMSTKCVKVSTKAREETSQIILTAYYPFLAHLKKSAKISVLKALGINGHTLRSMGAEQLKILYEYLATAMSVVTIETARRDTIGK